MFQLYAFYDHPDLKGPCAQIVYSLASKHSPYIIYYMSKPYSRSPKVGNPIASILKSHIGNPSTICP